MDLLDIELVGKLNRFSIRVALEMDGQIPGVNQFC